MSKLEFVKMNVPSLFYWGLAMLTRLGPSLPRNFSLILNLFSSCSCFTSGARSCFSGNSRKKALILLESDNEQLGYFKDFAVGY